MPDRENYVIVMKDGADGQVVGTGSVRRARCERQLKRYKSLYPNNELVVMLASEAPQHHVVPLTEEPKS